MMSLPNSDIFTRISNRDEKQKLLNDLIYSHGEILAKPVEDKDNIYALKAITLDELVIHASFVSKPRSMNSQGSVIIMFYLGGEKYFFQADYKIIAGQLSILCVDPIYHLQRREDYRIKIPNSFLASVRATVMDGTSIDYTWKILDLSAGGCLIAADTQRFGIKKNQKFNLILDVKDRETIELEAEAMHVEEQQFGVQFLNLRPNVRNRLYAIVMDIYRELFTV